MARMWLMAVVLLVGCADEVGQAEPPTCRADQDELLGCCAAGESCTWAAPVAEQCTDEFTSFCAHGLGWCEEGVCRTICREGVRCEAGYVEHHAPNADLGDADLCTCVPG